MILSSVLLPVVLHFLRQIIDQGFINKNFRLFNLLLAGVILVFIVNGFLSYGYTYLIAKAGQKTIMELRIRLYAHMQYLSLSFFEKSRVGNLMSRVTNDVGLLQILLTTGVIDFLSNIFKLSALVGFIFMTNATLATITLIGAPLIAVCLGRYNKRLRKITHAVQGKFGDLSSHLQETLSSMKVVQSFAMQDYEIQRFRVKNIENYRETMEGVKIAALLAPVIQLMGIAGMMIALWFGGYFVTIGKLTTGDLVAFMAAVFMIGTPLRELVRLNNTVQQGLVGAERIFEILDMEPEIKEEKDAADMPEIKGHVKFDGVTFSYDGKETVLEDVTIEANPGEVVALVGMSGAGKTTLVNLIPRFYDPVKGCLMIDSVDVRTVKLNSLREQMGIVPQETILFGGSIRENIAYGNMKATIEEIQEAARQANAHDFIMALPEKYDTVAGERGVRLSGGQRQRIAIARALLKNPRILILDEATSSLDSESESLVQEALERLMRGRTTFVIAHRLSTVRDADKIFVIDKGKVKECGVHQELYAKKGLYHKMVRNQEMQLQETVH